MAFNATSRSWEFVTTEASGLVTVAGRGVTAMGCGVAASVVALYPQSAGAEIVRSLGY